jgi:transcriptional regulator with XRE-family HTH domain
MGRDFATKLTISERARASDRLTWSARKAKPSLGYVARLETGHHDLAVTTLHKLAKALGVPVTEPLG